MRSLLPEMIGRCRSVSELLRCILGEAGTRYAGARGAVIGLGSGEEYSMVLRILWPPLLSHLNGDFCDGYLSVEVLMKRRY